MNSIFLVFAPEVFVSLQPLVPITSLSAVVCIDVAIRPISSQRDRSSKALVGLAFLLFPFMVALPYFEWKHLTSQYIPYLLSISTPTGEMVLLIGSAILLVSRIQIGIYGGPKIAIEENHRLITDGIYRHTRNPQYLGFLLIFTGYSLSHGSLLVSLVTALCLYTIFRNRIFLEEKLLLEVFGEEYEDYMKRTRRF